MRGRPRRFNGRLVLTFPRSRRRGWTCGEGPNRLDRSGTDATASGGDAGNRKSFVRGGFEETEIGRHKSYLRGVEFPLEGERGG